MFCPRPRCPDFGLSPVDPALRTDMEVGAQRVRRITFARNDLVDMAWVMTDAEFAAFRAWWNDEAWSLAGDSESLAGMELVECNAGHRHRPVARWCDR